MVRETREIGRREADARLERWAVDVKCKKQVGSTHTRPRQGDCPGAGRKERAIVLAAVAEKNWEDRINDKIINFGLRSETNPIHKAIYAFGEQRRDKRWEKSDLGQQVTSAMLFRSSLMGRFEELGIKPPTYTVEEGEEPIMYGWYWHVKNMESKCAYDLTLKPDRLDPKLWNVQAVAYKSLDMLTFSNRLEEWKGSFKVDGYWSPENMEAVATTIGACCKVLEQLEHPGVKIEGQGTWVSAAAQEIT